MTDTTDTTDTIDTIEISEKIEMPGMADHRFDRKKAEKEKSEEIRDAKFLEFRGIFHLAKDFHGTKIDSAYFQLLPYLFYRLNWQGDPEILIDSLPYRRERFRDFDLFNVLANLRYVTTKRVLNTRSLDNRLLPCIVEHTVNGEIVPYIYNSLSEDQIEYFDPATQSLKTITNPELDLPCYFIKKIDPEKDIDQSIYKLDTTSLYWMLILLKRHNKSIIWILVLTFFGTFASLLTPIYVTNVYDKVLGSGNLNMLYVLTSGVIIVIFFDYTVNFIRNKILVWIACRLEYSITIALFTKLMRFAPSVTTQSTLSSHISRIKSFESIRELITGPTFSQIIDFPFVVVFIVIIGMIAPPLVMVPIFSMIIYGMYSFYMIQRLELNIIETGKLKNLKQRILLETFEKLPDLKKMGNLDVWLEKFEEGSGKSSYQNFLNSATGNQTEHFAYIVSTASGIITITMGILFVWKQTMTVGELVAAMMLTWKVLNPLQTICMTSGKLKSITSAITQIHRFLSMPEETTTAEKGLHKVIKTSKVEIKNIGIKFNNQSGVIINGLSTVVGPGSFVTINGVSGSGKTVLLKLINGIYEPQMGSIKIDDIDTKQFTPMKMRRLVPLINTKPCIITGTIYENIIVGNYRVSKNYVLDFIKEMGMENDFKGKYHLDYRITHSNLNGFPFRVSYKIELLRAVLKNAKVYLFDEIPSIIVNSKEWWDTFAKIREKLKGATIFLVTKNNFIIDSSDLLLYFAGKGQIFAGPPKQLKQSLAQKEKRPVAA
jgi:ATP-binding cassette subfamily C protein LapB